MKRSLLVSPQSRRQFLAGAGSLGLTGLLGASGSGADESVVFPFANGNRNLAMNFPQKGAMVLQRARPPMLETPFEVFDQGVFTPNDRFYVRWHLAKIPTVVDPGTFRLNVRGHVQQSTSFSLDELVRKFKPIEIAAVNQCSGNSRGLRLQLQQAAAQADDPGPVPGAHDADPASGRELRGPHRPAREHLGRQLECRQEYERGISMHASGVLSRVRAQRLIALTLIAAGAAAVPATEARASATARAATAREAPGSVLAGTGVLDDVAATSAGNAWAVGHYGGLSQPRTLIEHWNGRTWNRVQAGPASSWLNGVAVTSAHDVWVVGSPRPKALILHFNGRAWRRMPIPGSPDGVFGAVAAISSRDAWAVGGAAAGQILIEHWNGTSWRRVTSPSQNGSFLAGVSAISARNVWAVGTDGRGTLTLHWNGRSWRRVASPNPTAGAQLEDVAAISARDVWAAGESARGTLILHWDGARWRQTASPPIAQGAGLLAVAGTSARDVWAVGTSGGLFAAASAPAASPVLVSGAAGRDAAITSATASTPEPVILHWNGTSWRRVAAGTPAHGGQLIGAFALSGRTAWAVGCTRTFGNRNAKPMVLRWNGTGW